jgi:hypothetical protein
MIWAKRQFETVSSLSGARFYAEKINRDRGVWPNMADIKFHSLFSAFTWLDAKAEWSKHPREMQR